MSAEGEDRYRKARYKGSAHKALENKPENGRTEKSVGVAGRCDARPVRGGGGEVKNSEGKRRDWLSGRQWQQKIHVSTRARKRGGVVRKRIESKNQRIRKNKHGRE